MEMDLGVYVSVLRDSLRDKWEVLQKILEITAQQEKILSEESVNADSFEQTLEKKDHLIAQLQKLDQGFEDVYRRAGTLIKENRNQYKSQILEMQNYIRVITDCSMKIQALEKKNKENFTQYLAGKRKEIRNFKESNRTANAYYQNMSNQHHQWQTYFLDQKK